MHADYEDWPDELAPTSRPAATAAAEPVIFCVQVWLRWVQPHLHLSSSGDLTLERGSTIVSATGVAPGLVVARLFVLRRVGGRPINFDQYRTRAPSPPFWPPKPFCLSFVFCRTVSESYLDHRENAGVLEAGVGVFCLEWRGDQVREYSPVSALPPRSARGARNR